MILKRKKNLFKNNKCLLIPLHSYMLYKLDKEINNNTLIMEYFNTLNPILIKGYPFKK